LTQFIFNGNIELINHKEEEDDFASCDEENYDNYIAERTQNVLNYTNEILNGGSNNNGSRRIKKNSSKVFPSKN